MTADILIREGAEDRLRDIKWALPADGPGGVGSGCNRFKRTSLHGPQTPTTLSGIACGTMGGRALKVRSARAGCCSLGAGRLYDSVEHGDRNLRKSESQ
jgi:hypothetical protein